MKYICSLIIGLMLSSCGGSQKAKQLNKEALTGEISQMLHAYHADIKKGGLTTEFAYLDSSEDFFWVPPGYNSALSYDSVRTILEGNALVFQAIEFHWKHLDIAPLTPEIATFSGIVKGTMTDTANVTSNVSILESGTLIKRADGWKLLSGQSAILE